MIGEHITKYMHLALEEASIGMDSGEVPVGCLITYKNSVIAKSHNQTIASKQVTDHAEILAIRQASSYLGDWRLNECDIYITLEPCLMCMGAIINSRIKNIYFGAYEEKTGALGSIYDLSTFHKKTKVVSGVLANESKDLLKKFFKELRE